LGILATSATTRNRRTFRIVKVLVTGASGFICGYLIQELLEHGYEVVGLDNFSKYGRLQKSYDSHPRYKLVEGNAKDVALMKELLPTATTSSRPQP
jgi:nucleoside-diphosphate-sugar epimerase